MDNKRTVFILAAGMGSRLKGLTADRPKALVTLNGTPLIKHVIDELLRNEFNHFVVNIHHFGQQIIDFLQKEYPNLNIDISDEREELLDTGGAVVKALPYLSDSAAVLVHNVDIISDYPLKELYDSFSLSNDAAWLITQQRDNKRKLVFDEKNNFLGRLNTQNGEYDGIRNLQKEFKTLSFSGIHLLKPQYFQEFPLKPDYIFNLYKQIALSANVKSIEPTHTFWFDLGTEQQLKTAESWLSSNH